MALSQYASLLDLDVLLHVARRSVLSPAFAMWVPMIMLSQRYRPGSTPFSVSIIYLSITTLIWLVGWSSNVWQNRLWQRGLPGLAGNHRVDWDEQVVVVTGGSSGLGRVIVETLAMKRVTTIVLDTRPLDVDLDDVLFIQTDVSDRAQVFAARDRIRKELGARTPSILINNAGIVRGKALLDLSESDIRTTHGVNLLAHYWTLQAFLPDMIQVTVASVLGCYGLPQLWLVALHESLQREIMFRYHAPNIRTTLVMPARLTTALFSTLGTMPALARFIAPVLQPHSVAKAIITALDYEESRDIYMPASMNLMFLLRGMPSWLRDLAIWSTDADQAMLQFNVKSN